MKMVIDIPDKDIPKQQDTMSVNFIFTAGYPCQCDYPFDVVEELDDAISRQAVLDILDNMVKDYINENDFDKAQGIAWVKVQKLSSASLKEPCEMTGEEYRQRMIQAFHNADCDELIAICVLPTEKEFEHLEWLLEKHYKAKPEPILEKVRDEIAHLHDWAFDREEILRIIDKYREPEEEKRCSNCKFWCLDANDKSRRCKYCYNQDEWQAESEECDEKKPMNPMSRADILDAAKKCVCGQREQDYGTPESNFQLIADLWNAYLNLPYHHSDINESRDTIPKISPTDVSMMMSLMKIARIKNGGGTGDSFVDLAGYAACGGEINSSRGLRAKAGVINE